jgi:hypothetical protein
MSDVLTQAADEAEQIAAKIEDAARDLLKSEFFGVQYQARVTIAKARRLRLLAACARKEAAHRAWIANQCDGPKADAAWKAADADLARLLAEEGAP